MILNSDKENIKEEEHIVEMSKVNMISLVMIIPLTAIILTPFIIIWGYESVKFGQEIMKIHFVIYLLGGIIVHELLHGVTWAIFTKSGLKSMKFGMQWQHLTPYCHCKEYLKVKHYKLGVAMPLIVMGIIPSLIGLVTGDGIILNFGIFFTWTASGDIIALYMLRKFDNNLLVLDHPEELGFTVKY